MGHFSIKVWFDQLQIPIAELVPDKTVECYCRFAVTVSIYAFLNFSGHLAGSRPNPPVREEGGLGLTGVKLLAIEQCRHKTGGVPQLVDKIAPSLDALFRKEHVATLSGQHRKREPEGIGTVGIEHQKRID